jgi:hypothetical protein
MRKSSIGGLMVVMLALLACATTSGQNDRLKADLVRRARFDLNCTNPIDAVPLQTQNDWVMSYGVLGCGRRATYVLTPDGVWVMNSAPDGKVQVDPSLMQPPPPLPPPAPIRHRRYTRRPRPIRRHRGCLPMSRRRSGTDRRPQPCRCRDQPKPAQFLLS